MITLYTDQDLNDLSVSNGNLLSNSRNNGVVDADVALKFDSDKVPMALFPSEAFEEICKVLSFGAKRYGNWNWANGMSWDRLASACLRHLFSWLKGESVDPDTGISHLSHAACNLIFLITMEKNKWGTDNRHVRK